MLITVLTTVSRQDWHSNVTCSLPENDVDGVPSPTEVQNTLKYFVPSVVDKLSTDGRLDLTKLNFFQQVNEE